MSSVNKALYCIINKKDFCCLCLCSLHDEPIRLNDEVIVNINNTEQETAISEVLNSIFYEQINSYITTFNALCQQCTKSAINCYIFKQTSQNNAEYLTKVFDGIANNFEYTTNELYDSKSLYVSLNPEDFTSKQFYDAKQITKTPRAVLRRLKALDNTNKIKVEDLTLQNIKKETFDTEVQKKRTRNTVDIPTSEMLLDKNLVTPRCKECFKGYPSVWNLRNHFIRVHAPKVFKCSKCPRRYGSVGFLDAHESESHCTAVCSECGKTFSNKHTLKMHENGHHLTLVCHDCGRIYKNKATFKKHIDFNVCGKETRANPSEAKYTCDYCNKKYTQKMSLRVHIQHEHGNYKSHVCEWCGKKFWAQSRLKAHIVKHTKEKKFPCSLCGKKFVSKESLLYHTRTHTGEKPYKCPHCEITFLSASRRSDHVKRHHLGATLECDICQSKFTSRNFLLKHKRAHTKPNNKINLTYEGVRANIMKISSESQTKIATMPISEAKPNNCWQIVKVDKNAVPSLKIIDTNEVDLNQFTVQAYEDDDTQQSSRDVKVYLEVSDDTDDYLKILGV